MISTKHLSMIYKENTNNLLICMSLSIVSINQKPKKKNVKEI